MIDLRRAGIGLAVVLGTTLSANAASEHDNQVFIAINGVTAFSFTQTGYSITNGQPYSGVTSGISKSGAQAQITVMAGRKGSSGPAQWFQQQVGSGQTLVCDTSGSFPDDLNFAVEGTINMTVGGKNITCNNVLVAQGNYLTVNNWWMGGPNMSGAHVGPTGATIQACAVQGSKIPAQVIFSPQTPCINNFSMGFVTGP
jgi:hypothetical protein